MIKELDTVILTRDIPQQKLRKGDLACGCPRASR